MNSDFGVGPWTVRPSLNTLSQNGTTARVEPKVMQVLVCLASRAGVAVQKEEIFKTVWPDTFVSDDVLVRSISELRRVFEDNARKPRFIETIPKRGYRLVATVTPVNGNNGNITAAPRKHSEPVKRNWKFAWVTVAALVLACAAFVGFNVGDLRGHIFGSKPPIHSIAVLPLKNLSDDPSQKYFASGMTEELITNLSQISALKVISRTSSEVYESTDKTLPEIARELNVDAIVEGSVARSGDRVRVTAQLIYAPEDRNLWAQSYERDMQDVLALEGTIANSIAAEIQVHVSPIEEARLRTARPINISALNYYLQGNYYLHRVAHGSVDDLAHKAAENFQRAIELDPSFAPAYIGLADAHGALMSPSPRDYQIRKAAIEKALQLDPYSSEAHDFMASIDLDDWNWAQAEEEFRRAIALNPNRASAHDGLGWFLFAMGRADEGEKELQVAQALDPNMNHLSGYLGYLGKYDEGIQLLLHDVERQPDNGQVHFDLFEDYALTGKYEEAIEHLAQAGKLFGLAEAAAPLEQTFRKAGFRQALRVAAENIEKMQSAGEVYMPGLLAELYTLAGDNDRALYWLEDATHHKYMTGADVGLVWLKGSPTYGPLRSDPRYKQLLKRVGLPSR